MFSEAKTIWQTAGTHAARDFERDILFAADGLRVAIFAKGLPAVADRLSLFQGVAEKWLVEEDQQTLQTAVARPKRAQSAIKRWDHRLAKQQNGGHGTRGGQF